jgi:hypothetical protein
MCPRLVLLRANLVSAIAVGHLAPVPYRLFDRRISFVPLWKTIAPPCAGMWGCEIGIIGILGTSNWSGMERGGRGLCVSPPADVCRDELFEGQGGFEQMHMLDIVQGMPGRKYDES